MHGPFPALTIPAEHAGSGVGPVVEATADADADATIWAVATPALDAGAADSTGGGVGSVPQPTAQNTSTSENRAPPLCLMRPAGSPR